MTTTSEISGDRIIEAGFAETRRGVQSAAQAFDDGQAGVDAEERAKAWRAILAGNLL